MVHHLRTDNADSGVHTVNSGVHTVIIAPVTDIKTKIHNKASKKNSNKADGITQPASEQHPNWIMDATTTGLETLLPDLSCTHCAFDGDISYRHHRLDSPQGRRKGNRKGKANGKQINK